jgi:hypothetical protein
MGTGTVTIGQFVEENQISITSERSDSNPHMDGSADMDNYKCTLNRPLEVESGSNRAFDVILAGKRIDTLFAKDDARADDIRASLVNHDGYDPSITVRKRRIPRAAKMTVYFSKGIGHHGAEPTTEEVLSCLADDAAGVENSPSFEDWCSEYGYDTDSRKAEKIFKACEHQATRLKNFLGDDLFEQLLWKVERA